MSSLQLYAIISALFLALLGGAFFSGVLVERSKCNARNLNKKLEITEVRNEIANKRPDRSGVVKRLRDGTF